MRDNPAATVTQAEHIINHFGTQERLADALGCRQSVIAGWKRRGFVPADRQEEVLAAARRLGIGLTPLDFFAGWSGVVRFHSGEGVTVHRVALVEQTIRNPQARVRAA